VCGSVSHPSPAVKGNDVPNRSQLDFIKTNVSRTAEEVKVLSERAGKLNGEYSANYNAILRKAEALFPDIAELSVKHESGGDAAIKIKSTAKEKARKTDADIIGVSKKLELIKNAESEHQLLTERSVRYTEYIAENRKKAEELAIELTRLETEKAGFERQLAELGERLEFKSKADAVNAVNDSRIWIEKYDEAKSKAEKELNSALITREKYTAAIEEIQSQLEESSAAEYDSLTDEFGKISEYRAGLSKRTAELRTRIERNRQAVCAVTEILSELAETGKRLAELKSISDTANGSLKGKERITLETFAQIRLFERIVQRAGTRLMKLTNGQYELIRRRENTHQGKSGLDIDVVDHYNGSVRSVRTLSGGEAFKASLALALGLSDETEAECGGIVIDSMFIDEGFGSLDDESLNQAVDMLASLASGDMGQSRSIGIISHVAELRERIDKQIIVKKSAADGSEISIAGI